MNLSKKLNIIGVRAFVFGFLCVTIAYFLRFSGRSLIMYVGFALIAVSLLTGIFKRIRSIYRRKTKTKRRRVHRIPYEATTLTPISDTEGYKKSESAPTLMQEEKSNTDCKQYQIYTIAPKSSKKRRRKKHRK